MSQHEIEVPAEEAPIETNEVQEMSMNNASIKEASIKVEAPVDDCTGSVNIKTEKPAPKKQNVPESTDSCCVIA